MKSIFVVFLTLFIVPVLQGCGSCTDNIETGLLITVSGEESGDNMCDVFVQIIDGDYLEERAGPSLENCDLDSVGFGMATERAGNYQIIVSKEGYETLTLDDVEVGHDGCHVIKEYVDIKLKRSGA